MSQVDVYKLHAAIVGDLFSPWSDHDRRFLALCLAGEVGELCNLVKKQQRGDCRWDDEHEAMARAELADIHIHLELLAKCFRVEGDKLDAEVEKKLQQVLARRRGDGQTYGQALAEQELFRQTW